jgi:hypothetical protein
MGWFNKLVNDAVSTVKNDVAKVESKVGSDFHVVVGAINNEAHNIGKGIKAAEMGITNGVKNTVRKIGEKFHDLGGDLECIELLPFVPAMMILLKSKNLSTKGSTKEIAIRFYNAFIAQNFESFTGEKTLDAIDKATDLDKQGYAGSAAGAVGGSAAAAALGLPPQIGGTLGVAAGKVTEGVMKTIVRAIINFLKGHLGKKTGIDDAIQAGKDTGKEIENIINGGKSADDNANNIVENHFTYSYKPLFHG